MIKIKDGWTTLQGLDKWTAELKVLLKETRDAAAEDDTDLRLKAAAFLAGFIQESAPQTPEMDQLDEIARKLAVDVMQQTIDQRLSAIAERTAEYVKVEKQLNAAAEQAEAAASGIRLKAVTSLIESATQVVNSAKSLAESLKDGSAADRRVAGQIESAVEAIENMRTMIAKLV